MKLNTYLHFIDNCEEAFEFYAKVLGGTIPMKMRFKDAPKEMPPLEGWENKIMHAQLVVGDTILMGSDSPPVCGDTSPMGGFSVSLNTNNPAEADKAFIGLSESGNIIMPLEETFWAHRFGMFTDRFGVRWMINCEKAEVTV